MPQNPSQKYILGLMSGTSMDGIDAVLISEDFLDTAAPQKAQQHWSLDYDNHFKALIHENLNELNLPKVMALSQIWSKKCSDFVSNILKMAKISHRDILAIGVHGPTISHYPPSSAAQAFSFQANNLSLIAYKTKIPCAGNFRSMDIAAGGEGAPLAPYGHRILFGKASKTISVHNLGGISNFTLIKDKQVVTSLDTGPANMWMDLAIRYKTQNKQQYDPEGSLAAKGKADETWKNKLLEHPYFQRPLPKSTGWEDFGFSFLNDHKEHIQKLSLENIMATLSEATAESIALAYSRFILPEHHLDEIIFCGGGSLNAHLIDLINQKLKLPVSTSDHYGYAYNKIEPICFALLAQQCLKKQTNSEPTATHAKEAVICGELSWPSHSC